MRHALLALLVVALVASPTFAHAQAGVSPDAGVVILIVPLLAAAFAAYSVLVLVHAATGWTPDTWCRNHQGELLHGPLCEENPQPGEAAGSSRVTVSEPAPVRESGGM